MIASLAALALTVVAATTHTDTTVSVRPGTRLELNAFAGSISVVTWSRNAVRLGADHSSHTRLALDEKGPVLNVRVEHWRGIPTSVEYQLTVPKWMSLDLSGVNTDISVENSEGEIAAETVQGEVLITGGAKIVKANSVEGEVRVARASGKIEANSVNAGVRLSECSGQILASSINGEVRMTDIASDDVEASTINGVVSYEGQIKDGGSYRFSTHSGDVSVAVPERANASVAVATYNGEFSSSFPVTLNQTRKGKRFDFTLGSGSARIELESFEGEIRLRHPGDPDTRRGNEFKYEYKYQYPMDKAKREVNKTKQKPKTKQDDGDPDEDQEP
ncbi:MAG: hypothetical protein E6K81_09960 [Candidatus Eisenbacteria bacterium]|uniref:DUF4097 domain-containing protein n=1 Tax=Eiseniibacteriota bacterium TaxID=2212470 RepID=A0A538U6H8_UNCEI|nr:MAG: hypothetical protein E6K81_09960 [Candidatus Eisenbacteria bacterium]